MQLVIIRHGQTIGNTEKRYIGSLDEPLCELGKSELYRKKSNKLYPQSDTIYISPMVRCAETADILYPGCVKHLIDDFKECDFGLFEGKNYKELSGNEEYQKWIDSNGTLPFPMGESRDECEQRCIRGLRQVINEIQEKLHENVTVVCIVHGGTIMSILNKLGSDNRSYYDYQCRNGEGYICEVRTAEGKNLVISDIRRLKEERI